MAAPNLKEVEWAISELENQESNESNYILLAALYTCRSQMLGETQPAQAIAAYSEASAPVVEVLGRYGDSDFLRAVDGAPAEEAWLVMDELMDTLRVVNNRVYSGVIKKIRGL